MNASSSEMVSPEPSRCWDMKGWSHVASMISIKSVYLGKVEVI